MLFSIRNPSFIASISRFSSSKLLNRSRFFTDFNSKSSKSEFKLKSESEMGVVAVSDEEGVARRFWIKFKKESVYAKFTPFVVCLASGNLKLETFRHYIAQDVHFLKAFAQAYELAEDCADDDDDKVLIREMWKSVVEELKMHGSFAQEWGFDPATETSANSATLKYTEFLLATASGKVDNGKGVSKVVTPFEKTKVAAYTLGAMTPCMRLYAFIGRELQELLDLDGGSHLYKKWIENYSSESFEVAAVRTEDLLDKLSVSLTGEELAVIEKLYHRAMKLEIDFFSAQPIDQCTVLPLSRCLDSAGHRLLIFSDFDLTCTVVDSSAILAEIAILTASKNNQNEPEKSSDALRNYWVDLSAQYTEEYEQCIENILPSEKAKEFDHEGLCKALEQLSDFEKRANARVVESGLLRGMNQEDIKRAGEHLILQDGCIDFFKKITKDEELNKDVHILSYCWCADLIRSAFSSGLLSGLNVHANEFAYNELISTGEIIKNVESPMDKVRLFKDITEKQSGKVLSVYIGDSVGDLLCLLQADVGIVVGSSESLRKIGSQFGVSFVPLFSGLVKKQKEFSESESSCWKGLSGTIYTVSSWAEIHALVLGSR
ncbi:beta ketoadipyl CoA thiolase [Ranunculus cassubicifolius]